MSRPLEGDRIYRYEVPVDDRWHEFDLTGDPLAVGCRSRGVVEFWACHSEIALSTHRTFLVVGTGHTLPTGVRHWGTVVTPGGQLVWHLVERVPS